MMEAKEHAIEEIKGRMCDEYCRFPRECKSQEELDTHCDHCGMMAFLNGNDGEGIRQQESLNKERGE